MHSGNGTIFRDVLMNLVLVLVVVLVFILPHIQPVAKDEQTRPPGNLIVAINWPAGNTDVDLWVYGPGEVRPVGYSNKGGRLWNLLRDDLGTYPDATDLNYENAYTRGVIAGEYIVNLHCYRCPTLPLKVYVEITLKNDAASKTALKRLAQTTVELRKRGEELTALRFQLTAQGQIVPNSLNHLFYPLRTFRK